MDDARATESPQASLRAAVDTLGSQSATARLLGITQAAVSIWLSKGQPLPPEHVLAVEAATGVSRYRLRPDVYGDAPPDERTPPATDATPRPADGASMEHWR